VDPSNPSAVDGIAASASRDGVILSVDNVSKQFGGVHALRGVTLGVPVGRIVGLIGPNGSGKTTLFNVITGMTRPSSGRIVMRDIVVSQLPPHRISQIGIGRTFQLTRLFGQMTTLENMLVVGRGDDATNQARAVELLEFVQLRGASYEYAGNLSYGQQKLLEFARVLMVDPSLILLDEPFAGVNPNMAEHLRVRLQLLVEQGKTLFITDHEMRAMMAMCTELFVLDYGQLIAHGTPREIRNNDRVVEAYFGR
jgi:ABC-type branched-subunit amino acid transport system ATPase component